ncbi:MAG TPA: hypothetical protein VGD59_11040 [Acidisarcina sp.]
MLGALLGALLPWNAVAAVYVMIALAASGLSLYTLAREWLPRQASVIAACLYIVNPYAMFVAYERTAFSELLAGVWLPLILLYALRSRAPDAASDSTSDPAPDSTSDPAPDSTSDSPPDSASDPVPARARAQPGPGREAAIFSAIPLALTVAAVWLTNAPAAVMASYTLAIVALVAAISERTWWPILRASTGAALGIAFAAFYIVPAAFERRWVDISRATAPGMRPQDSFLFEHTGEAFHDQVLHTASWIAVSLLTAFALATLASWRSRRLGRRHPSPKPALPGHPPALPPLVYRPMLILPPLLLLLMLPLSNFIWRHAPELAFLQFPWRWLLVLSIVASIAVAIAFDIPLARFQAAPTTAATPAAHPGSPPAATRRMQIAAAALLAAAAALIYTEQRLFWQPCDSEDMVSNQLTVFHHEGFAGTDEYTTPGVDNESIQQGLPAVRILTAIDEDEADSSVDPNPPWSPPTALSTSPANHPAHPAQLKLLTWEDESKAFTVSAAAPAYAVLRLLDYPAWEVRVNGTLLPIRPHRADGLMTVPLHAGVSVISVHYRTTPDVRWGRAISVAALVVLLLLVLRQRRNRRL